VSTCQATSTILGQYQYYWNGQSEYILVCNLQVLISKGTNWSHFPWDHFITGSWCTMFYQISLFTYTTIGYSLAIVYTKNYWYCVTQYTCWSHQTTYHRSISFKSQCSYMLYLEKQYMVQHSNVRHDTPYVKTTSNITLLITISNDIICSCLVAKTISRS